MSTLEVRKKVSADSYAIEQTLALPCMLVKAGTDPRYQRAVCTANTDKATHVVQQKVDAVGDVALCQPLTPGQVLEFVSDGTITADKQEVCASDATNGYAELATAGDWVVALSLMAQTSSGKIVLVETVVGYAKA